MKRLLGTALALSTLLGVAVGPAAAQLPPQGIGPTPMRPPGFGQSNLPAYSPYLNLLFSGNNSPLLGGSPFLQNYYGLVLPQVNTMSALQNLQDQTYSSQQAITGAQTGAALLPPTGHAATFMNTGRYFMYRGGQGTIGYGGQTMGAGLNRNPAFGGGTLGGGAVGGGIMGGGVMGSGAPPTNPFQR